MAAAPPATPRHPNHSLPLLPSGPGGVCELSSRGDRRGHHGRQAIMLGLLLRRPARPSHDSNSGGESGIRTRDRFYPIHTFQACSFNHSDTSPYNFFAPRSPSGIVRLILSLTPHWRSELLWRLSLSFQTNLSNPRQVLPYAQLQRHPSFNHSDTSAQ